MCHRWFNISPRGRLQVQISYQWDGSLHPWALISGACNFCWCSLLWNRRQRHVRLYRFGGGDKCCPNFSWCGVGEGWIMWCRFLEQRHNVGPLCQSILNHLCLRCLCHCKLLLDDLEQATVLAFDNLVKYLSTHGYVPIPHTIGLWQHATK